MPLPLTSASIVRAVVAHGAGDVRVEERTVPPIPAGHVGVQVHFGGICGSDVHYYRRGGVGDFTLVEPMVLGHEIAGRVDEVGQTLPGGPPGPRLGAAVTVHPATPCRVWPGHEGVPANLADPVRYLGSAASRPHTQGAFAERVLVRFDQVVPLPDGLDLRRAALAEPLGVAIHAVRQAAAHLVPGRAPGGPLAGLLTGRAVLVTGCGPIGCLVVAAARAAGAGRITVTDLSARALTVGSACGADAALDVSGLAPAEVAARVGEHDVVVESSGTVPGLAAALRAARRGGVVVALGLLPPGDLPIPANLLVTRELTLVGSFRFVAEIDEAVALLAAGLEVSAVLSHELPFDDATAALDLAADAATSTKVLLRFPAAGS